MGDKLWPPCSHPGCYSHVTHPCEGCGRLMGRLPGAVQADDDLSVLRHTIGSAGWLDSLDDDQWRVLWGEIAPVLLEEARRRKRLEFT